MKTIKGFAITPPVLGSIRIGKAVIKGDKKIPQKDDAFTITTLVQNKDGWIAHALHDEVLKQQPPAREGAQQKIRAIPVRLMFDDPDLNLRAEYSAFDPKTGRPICAGDGETARRRTSNGIEEMACPGSDGCAFGREKRCKLYARMNVQIDGQDDELGTFVFRTTGFNSVRSLSARLSYMHAITGGQLAGLPLSLRLRAKTSSNSYKSVVYFVDLVVRDGMTLPEAVTAAKASRQQWCELGLSREAFEAAARSGFGRSAFEDVEEDGAEVVEEFFQPSERAVPASEYIDGDGVIHPAGAPRQEEGGRDAGHRPSGGLASLRAVMNTAGDATEKERMAEQQNWHIPIDF